MPEITSAMPDETTDTPVVTDTRVDVFYEALILVARRFGGERYAIELGDWISTQIATRE